MSVIRYPMIWIVTALALVCQAPAANAKVTVSERTTYYSVRGDSGGQLGKALLTGGYGAINVAQAIAATASRLSLPVFRTEVKNGRCVVTNVTVALNITYRFPKWSDRGRASNRVRGAWEVFYRELVRHEHQHGAISRQHADRLERELKRLSDTGSFGCQSLKRMATVSFDKWSKKLKKAQVLFDRLEDSDMSKITRLQLALFKAK